MTTGAAVTLRLAVCGLHMRGRPLSQHLTRIGATFIEACKSAPIYRLFALTDCATGVIKPGMVRTTSGGCSVALEVFDVPLPGIGQLLVQVPPPLALGTVFLEDGSAVKGFICEGHIAQGAPGIQDAGLGIEDISEFGGFYEWLEREQRS